MPLPPVSPEVSMTAHMSLALLLGWLVGYERYYGGRAAGTQVYCLVCTTSCAVTLLAGYPQLWYWGTSHEAAGGDPTRVIGSILTGIGFLGAGIIVKSGLSVRGLTTAASIWGTSAIGILVGAGFYLPAFGLALLFVLCMAVIPRLEGRLPAHGAIAATLRFREGYSLRTEEIHRFLAERSLSIPSDSITITHDKSGFELNCLIVADSAARANALGRIALELPKVPEVESFTVTHSSRA
jgi:putative Mg2+ transporter-C (MgtC) family protein